MTDEEEQHESADDGADAPRGDEASEPDDVPSELGDDDSEPGELVGEVISDRYRLDAFVGGGGMGEVYRGEHVMMKKTVAVKILRPEFARGEHLVERFRREAQAAGNLEHPNICSATDFGRDDEGRFYLVMEFVDGTNLGDILARQGALEVDRALEIARQIADALEAAHEAGVVHRDLKPENVMLVGDDGSERVKVLDFGVSRVQMADDMPSITKTGAIFGTPHYMSPEQAGGEEVDRRADIYGLGSVLYEMLAGRPVFDADKSVHVMAAHLKDEPEPISECAPWAEVSEDLEALVLSMLAKEPEDRPETAREVRRRLDALGSEEAGGSPERSAATTRASSGSEARDADSSHLLERTGESTRTFYRVLDRRLPVDLGVDDISGSVLAIVTMFAFSTVLLCGVGAIFTARTFLDRVAPGSARETLRAERQSFQTYDAVSTAMRAFRAGRPEEAADKLGELERDYGSNPHFHYLYARTLTGIDRWKGALEHYREALRLRPNYSTDPALLDDLVYALGSQPADVRKLARNILRTRVSEPHVRDRLARTAWHAESRRRRNGAWKVLSEAEVLEKLPSWVRHAILLRRETGCDNSREHIRALADSGTDGALEIIRLYHRRPRSGCGSFGSEDCLGCVRDDLRQALQTLQDGKAATDS